MSTDSHPLKYTVNAAELSAGELVRIAQDLCEQAKRPDSAVHREALKLGIDVDALPDDLSTALEIRAPGARIGVDPFSLLVGALLAGAGKASKDLWVKIVLPRLIKKYGPNAITVAEKAKKDMTEAGKLDKTEPVFEAEKPATAKKSAAKSEGKGKTKSDK